MIKTFLDLTGNTFNVDFKEHDISKYDVLYHVTLKKNRGNIEKEGLLRNQPQHKSLVQTGMIFVSYPIDGDTSDLFRWSDEHYSLIVLDAKALREDGFMFYDDYFGSEDRSSKRNHLAIDRNIPAKYIKKILEW